MIFNAAAIKALYSAVESHAKALNIFQRVNGHEPENAPGSGLSCSILLGPLAPARGVSGLSATSCLLEFSARIYLPRLAKPEDGTDPKVLDAACQLMAAYSADFTLGGLAMEVDLLGAYGSPLSTAPGYLEQDGSLFRIQQVTLPIILDNVWVQEATNG